MMPVFLNAILVKYTYIQTNTILKMYPLSGPLHMQMHKTPCEGIWLTITQALS